jgi:hypothetical protein
MCALNIQRWTIGNEPRSLAHRSLSSCGEKATAARDIRRGREGMPGTSERWGATTAGISSRENCASPRVLVAGSSGESVTTFPPLSASGNTHRHGGCACHHRHDCDERGGNRRSCNCKEGWATSSGLLRMGRFAMRLAQRRSRRWRRQSWRVAAWVR